MADNPLDIQIGGNHYKDCVIQPVEFITKNKIGFLPGCVIKRMTRYNQPGGKGLEDLKKAIHEIELMIEFFPKETEKRLDCERRPKGQWISVKNSLPTSGRYLVSLWDQENIYIASYDHMSKSWMLSQNNDISLRVTHWMPLPEPPGR